MVCPFNELRERLLRAGIAPRHVRRYLRELSDHLADLAAEEKSKGLDRQDAESVALARLGSMDDLALAMIQQRQFQSWSVRAPWAAMGLVPLCFLAAAWFAACFILWSGWQVFLPGASTPFIPVEGIGVLYFGVGRMLYFTAPVLIGWGIALVAARQRLQTGWPAVGLALLALAGAAAHVHAARTALSGGVARVSMSFTLGNSTGEIVNGVLRTLVLLTLMAAPYLAWRLRRAFLRPAR
jgi:hypothetical protein